MSAKQSINKLGVNSILSIGLDVSKEKIDVCCLSKKEKSYFSIKNQKAKLMKFVKDLQDTGLGKDIPIIVESTGDLHLLVCLLLSEAKFCIKEINPIITKQFTNCTVRGTKTDKTDSLHLAEIGYTKQYEFRTFNRSKEYIKIKKNLSLISSLERNIQSLGAIIKNHMATAKTLGIDVSSIVFKIKETIETLKKQKGVLETEIENFQLEDESENERIDRIDSIVGISPYIAKVCYFIFANKNFESKEAMYAFVGLDPKLKQSGYKSVGKRISKRGNNYVRKKLFQAAFCAKKHCKIFADIYDRLIKKGKHHCVAVLGIAKKIIHIMRSLIKNKTFFDENYKVI